MARKRALVVDDSKSARVILSRMLEKYDIDVDMAESAEQAIEYLNQNRPQAIFMDHLMPGMDGFQAVKAIKGNPHTATIPIMMYTSQEGELYVGQARALGALGVLPKQVRPVDVSKVLYELHLLPDRRDPAEPALAAVELDAGSKTDRAAESAASGSGPSIEWLRRIESAVKDQTTEVRRFLAASLDGFASRIVNDVRESALPAVTLPPPVVVSRRTPVWPWVIAVAVSALAAAALWSTREQLLRTGGEITALKAANAELRRSSQALEATVKALTAALAANAAGTNASAAASKAATAARIEPVPYGEIPFDRSRLDIMRELLAKLESQGFRGVVKVTSAAGLFCLSGSLTDGYAPANPALPAAKCDVVGNPFEESLTAQQRESPAFANLIAGVRQRTSGAITVALETAGTARVAAPYPQRTDAFTAGDWNRTAALNNRVEFVAEPSAKVDALP